MNLTGAEGAAAGRRSGALLAALLVGAALPWGAFAYFAAKGDPVPASCTVGDSTAPGRGTILYSTGPALILAQANLGNPKKVVDYSAAPAPASPSPAESASPVPSATVSARPSGSPAGPASASIIAAALSPDGKNLAYLVAHPPGHTGNVGLHITATTADPATEPPEVWNGTYGRGDMASELTWIGTGLLLFKTPVAGAAGEGPHRAVGVMRLAPGPQLIRGATESEYLTSVKATWPETSDLPVPPQLPALRSRLIGPGGRAAGLADETIRNPVMTRSVAALRLGRGGDGSTSRLCVLPADARPVRFSPDGGTLAVSRPAGTYLLGLDGRHGMTRLLSGQLLDWAAPPPGPPTPVASPSPSPSAP